MSLQHLFLRDFVIVDELDLQWRNGFTALTGETGAGKSILIDALQLVLGARADSGVVREGAARADISASFEASASVRAWLHEQGFDHDDAEDLLLRRTIDAQGKSRAWINGQPATATQLRALGDQLLDIHGQHAWQSLTRPEAVRGLLDAYAGVRLDALHAAWTQWRQALATLQQARAAQDSLQQERERLQWQLAELDKLAPGRDEWDELNTQHTRLSHAQALMDAAQAAIDGLVDDEQGALVRLTRAHQMLDDQSRYEPEFAALAEVLSSCLAQAGDVAHSLHAYLGRAELDPGRLQTLDERVSLWLSLARRFKRTPETLPALYDEWRAQLAALDAAADVPALEAAEQAAAAAYQAAARQVSQARGKAAPKLAKAITEAMQGLGMAGGRFEVQLQACTEPTAHGLEDVGFLVAGHAGSTPRPVGKVASGGELSRIALAIAVTTSQLGTAPTLIFDEVDSGIGGAVAETVGRLMQQLGQDRQVLAVTHLPQVAACAHQHWVVSKETQGVGHTRSQVRPVTQEDRVAEIARMLGGEKISATTLAHAREMLGLIGAQA